MGQTHCSGRGDQADAHEELVCQLEEAIAQGNTLKCHEILSKVNVNTVLPTSLRAPLVVATTSNSVKMVRFLLRYDNSEYNRNSALEFALLYVGRNVDFDVVSTLVRSGCCITSPMTLCQFFMKNCHNPKLCEQFIRMILHHFSRQQTRVHLTGQGFQFNSQRYRLLGVVLKLATLVACDMWGYSVLDKNHEFIPGYCPYKLVYLLLLHGASAESFWDPLFKDDGGSPYSAIHSCSAASGMDTATLTMPKIDLPIISLFLRTAVGSSVPAKVDQLLYYYANFYAKYDICKDLIDNVEHLLRILLLTGVALQKSKLYFLGNVQDVTSPDRTRRAAIQKIHSVCEKLKMALPLSLQECCRLSVQRHLCGPNLLFSLNYVTDLPKAIKKIVILEHLSDVKALEMCK